MKRRWSRLTLDESQGEKWFMVLCWALVGAFLVAWIGSRRDPPPEPLLVYNWRVIEPGDTFWKLAGQCPLPFSDRREKVAFLMRLNRKATPALLAGERILVPTLPQKAEGPRLAQSIQLPRN